MEYFCDYRDMHGEKQANDSPGSVSGMHCMAHNVVGGDGGRHCQIVGTFAAKGLDERRPTTRTCLMLAHLKQRVGNV